MTNRKKCQTATYSGNGKRRKVAHDGETKDDSVRCQKANMQMKKKDYKSVSDAETNSDDQPRRKKIRISALILFRFILIKCIQVRFLY